MVVDFRFDKVNHAPFINRQSVKVLRKCFAGYRHCQLFKRKENMFILDKIRRSNNQAEELNVALAGCNRGVIKGVYNIW